MPDASYAAAEDPARLAAWLARNAVDSLPTGALAERLARAHAGGRQLRVKLGIDPTAPDIHLGHAVVLGKLREFQRAGHRVVLIIGDYTARVGDPSGRSSLRPMLSEQEIEDNAATFQEQALKILDSDPESLEVRRNSEWLGMSMVELFGLVRTTTVAQILERDDFAKRWSASQPISLLELLYPLLQAYDSVAIDADVELGGTDQKFNLLLGREVQRAYGRSEQAILTMPLLLGTDGSRKMSKSLGNQIGVTDLPEDVFGKAMSIPDEAISEYRRLLLQDADVARGHAVDAEKTAAPLGGNAARDAKRDLARDLVALLYSSDAALDAERSFERVFVQREEPEEIEEAGFELDGGVVHLPGLMGAQFGLSSSEARRLIDQGAVSLGGTALAPGEYDVQGASADGQVLKVGKRRFRRLRAS